MPTLPTPSSVARTSLRRDVWCALAVVMLSLLFRFPRMGQSLWLDEMTTLSGYVLRPWSKVLAADAGQYVPNNHVLHTVLAKGVYTNLVGGREALESGHLPAEAVLRLPSLVAGSLLPVALAWPLRRRTPAAALAVAVVAAIHPWLVDLGAEARGYTLMLLLGTIATALLPTVDTRRRGVAGYAVTVAAAIYTIPLAVLLVPAHAVAVWATRRAAWRKWAVGVGIALLLATALYLPMVRGLIAYYRNPYSAVDYRTFLDGLPRHVLTGQRTPRVRVDPALPRALDHLPDAPGSAVFWALPVLVVIIGTGLAWPRFPEARPLVATLATASALGVALPLAVPGATEVRFVTWAAPWFCLTAVLMIAAMAEVVPRALGRSVAAANLAVLLGLMVWWDVQLPPNQRVREAVALADRLAPKDGPIAIAYVGAFETCTLYSAVAPDHPLLPALDGDQLTQVEGLGRAANGRLPWVIILFEQMARDRSATDAGTAGLWRELTTRYRLVARLDGRVTPVAVYAPREGAATFPAVADGR